MVKQETAPMRILGISGSLRRASFNSNALRAAVELAPEGITIDIGSLNDDPPVNLIGELTLYNEDIQEQGFPETLLEFASEVRKADALLVASPEYNFGMSAALKNAIDWLSRLPDDPLNGKPVAVISASPGMLGGVHSQMSFRQTARSLNMHVLNRPNVLIGQAKMKFDEAGRLIDEPTRDYLAKQIEALREWALKIRG
jgi:chromate reductase, NAD(P)H dehydrogenase (quinone)